MIRRTWTILGALLVSAALAVPAWAEEADLERRLQELERKLQRLEGRPMAPGAPAPKEGKRLQELAEPRTEEKKYGSTMQGSGGLIYARPFVASPKAIVGGYTDIEYFNRANDGGSSFFDAHRLVPFIYGDVSDRVKFAAEIEFEHFSRGKLEDSGRSGSEIGVEFMSIDYLITDPLNLRAGIILVPLGKFNLLHDAPLRDLTDRPLINQRIIPTTLSQPGVGIYGTMYPTRLSKLDYELYLTAGFTGFEAGDTSPISGSGGLRSARARGANENNNGKSVVGRVAFSPILGIEVGGSGFFGSYDPNSSRALSIWAIDGTLQRGPFEIIGEAAWAYAKDNHLDLTGTPVTDSAFDGTFQKARRMNGYYVQLNYHFLPELLVRLAPTHFRPEVSTFTAVVRWEETDLNNEVDGNFSAAREFQRLTLGLNFRPTEDTVFKFDFQYSPKDIGNENGQSNKPVQDTAFIASWATYF